MKIRQKAKKFMFRSGFNILFPFFLFSFFLFFLFIFFSSYFSGLEAIASPAAVLLSEVALCAHHFSSGWALSAGYQKKRHSCP
jgi:hypothetical protein